MIGAGRASEVSDLGDGRVLRRGGNPEREARVMAHAAANGYPVPRVFEIGADALVLERIDGPTMLGDLWRRPWRLSVHAGTLARLHRALHEIDAPAELGEGRLLHMDLHPENVMLSPSGPVVIDWTNARAGDPALDVAMTWVIGATSGGVPGRLFVRTFRTYFDRSDIRGALPAAAEIRMADPNVTEQERAAVRRLVRSNG